MILDEILKKTSHDLEIKKQKISFELLEEKLSSKKIIIKDVLKALSEKNQINILAELKKASPSKGLIRPDFDVLKLARVYEKAGVSAISVLTEPHFFKGSLKNLEILKEANISLPLLRKDFIIDKYQILEALIYGADFILLIAKALDFKDLKKLFNFARDIGLEVLFEIHDEQDLQKALKCGANILGINHRNLQTFELDFKLCEVLIPKIPKGKVLVAESGLDSPKILKKLHSQGIDAFLIGEHFMRQDNMKDEIKNFKNALKY